MKKVFFFFLLLLVYINNIYAEEYTSFSNYMYSDEFLETSDLIEVEKVKKYKYYKEEKEYAMDYMYENEIPYDYPFISKEEYIEGPLTDWSQEKPNDKDGRIINIRETNTYRLYQPLRTAEIYVKEDLWLSEMEFFKSDYKFVFNVVNKSMDAIDLLKLKDNNKDEYVKVPANSVLEIDFISYRHPHTLHFNLFTKEYEKTNIEMKFRTDVFSTEYQYILRINDPLSLDVYHTNLYEIMVNPKLTTVEVNTYENFDHNPLCILKNKIIEYQYSDRLYRYYNLKRTYLDDYYFDVDDYIRDDNNYKYVYKYRIRNKIINNEIIKEQIVEKEIPKIEYKTRYISQVVPLEIPKIEVKKEEIVKEKKDYLTSFLVYGIIGFSIKKFSIFK
ncbi:MAG: hypothetical protein PHQ64_04040 [Bacilli bacterium]|nr:hypothetical protein [Bacilli bacterium]